MVLWEPSNSSRRSSVHTLRTPICNKYEVRLTLITELARDVAGSILPEEPENIVSDMPTPSCLRASDANGIMIGQLYLYCVYNPVAGSMS